MVKELTITKKKKSSFQGGEGDMIDYFWYTGEDKAGLAIQFGSKRDDIAVGEVVEVNVQKVEMSNGKLGWKEVEE